MSEEIKITIMLKMDGQKQNCSKVKKQIISRIRDLLQEPDSYMGRGEVNYNYEMSVAKSPKNVVA